MQQLSSIAIISYKHAERADTPYTGTCSHRPVDPVLERADLASYLCASVTNLLTC